MNFEQHTIDQQRMKLQGMNLEQQLLINRGMNKH